MNRKKYWLRLTGLLFLLPIAGQAADLASNSDGELSDKPSFNRSPLVNQVRQATEIYRQVENATAAGYIPTACASGRNGGAMGIHYVNPSLLFNADGTPNGEFDVNTPEVLIYEPRNNGKLALVGVEFIVFAEPWDAAHTDGSSPVVMGQLFHFTGAPNRYRLPPHYELHVWAYRRNPNGTFADWNSNVSCEAYGI